MKRSSKIFALVLSLALILGALAIATFAAASDVKVVKAADFEELAVGKSNTASDNQNPTYDSYVFQQGGRAGKIEVKEGSDGNKYVLITQEDYVKDSGPYIYGAVGSKQTVNKEKDAETGKDVITSFNDSKDDFEKYKFVSAEIDVMSPTGKFIEGNIDLSARAVDKNGSVNFWNTNATTAIVKFGNDNNGSYIFAGFDSTVKKYVNPYEFTNIQIIVENLTAEDATNYALQSHVYVNGELWFTKVASNVPTSYFGGDMNAAFVEYKINYLAKNDDSMSLAVDNLVWKTVPAGSETEVADLVSYNAEARPAGLVVATVDGVDYNTLEGAIAAAADGSTINVLVDKYTPTTVDNKNITINAGDKYLNLVAGSRAKLESAENGVYKFTKVIVGVTTKKSSNMQSSSGGGVGTNPSNTGYAWSLTSADSKDYDGDGDKKDTVARRGTTSVGQSADGNKYIVYTQTGGYAYAGYVGTGYGAIGTTFAGGRPTVSGGVYSKLDTNNEYLVFDVDIMSPTGSFAAVNFNLELRGFKAGDTTIDVLSTNSQQALYMNAGANTIQKSGVAGAAHKVNPFEFTHITVIYDKVVKDGYITVDSYVYINGEFFGYTAGNDPTGGKGASFYEGSVPHLVWEEIRINFATNDDATQSFAFDNMYTRLISSDYNGNLAEVLAAKDSINNWESSIYDASKMPVGINVAKVGDVEYDNFDEALLAGDEVTLLYNIAGATTVNKACTILKNGFTANLVAAEGLKVEETDDAYTVTVRAKQFEYVKGGKTAYTYTDAPAALNTVVSNADSGTTIKFHTDYKYDGNVSVSSSKTITIDLNGFTYDATHVGDKNNITSGITVDGNLTFTSSAAGAKVFFGASKSGGDPFFVNNSNSTITIKGSDEYGNTTLSMFGPTVTQAWSSTNVKFYIDGGEYYRTTSDNSGFIQLQGTFTAEVKNALVYDLFGEMFHLPGRAAPAADAINSTLVVDNCVLIAKSSVMSYTFKEMSATFTNNYIIGGFGNSVWTATSETAGKITLGEGNFLTGTYKEENTVIPDGLSAIGVDYDYSRFVDYNTFSGTEADGFEASTFVLDEYKIEKTFTKYIGAQAPELVTVTWKSADGKILGTTKARPGAIIAAPTTLHGEAVVDGWVASVPAEWATELKVPADATEYEVIAKEGARARVVADVRLLFNFNLTTHFEYIMYVPEELEGITVTAVDFRADRFVAYKEYRDGIRANGKFIIDGKNYVKVDGWPGIAEAATGSTCGITFTYGGKTYSVATKISIPLYVDKVLDPANGYSEEAKILAVNTANYVYQANLAANKSANAALLEDVVANNSARIISVPEDKKVVPDTSAINQYIAGVTLYIDTYGPRYQFLLTEAGKEVYNITITVGTSTTNIRHGDTDTMAEIKAKGFVYTNNARLIHLNNATISVQPAEGAAKLSVNFKLANYYAILATDPNNAKFLPLVDSLYGFAEAGNAYKSITLK